MKVGDKFVTKSGRAIEIHEYTNARKVIIRFEDGTLKEVSAGNITKGSIAHPADSRVPKIGSRWESLSYGGFTVVEYNHARDIIIEFDEPYKCRIRTENRSVKAGEVKNPMKPDERGFFIGCGKYDSKNKMYQVWSHIKKRIGNYNNRSPSYSDVTICEEWYNFQNFAEWYVNQIGSKETGWHIDKDILIKGNKVYEPNNCVLVPVQINSALTKRNVERGFTPIGVHFHKRDLTYYCQYTENGEAVYAGIYDTPEEAFYVYKDLKEKHIKSLAEFWRDKIDPRAYNALMNYTVEITD